MAQYGLQDSDTESDSHQSHSSTSSQRTRSNSGSTVSLQHQHDTEDEDIEEDDAPPAASLGLSADEMEYDLDHSEEESKSIRSNSKAFSRQSRQRSILQDDDNMSLSSARRGSVKRKLGSVGRNHGNSDEPWACRLKLQPKRVNVMQASFFRQDDQDQVMDGVKEVKVDRIKPVSVDFPPQIEPEPIQPRKEVSTVVTAD